MKTPAFLIPALAILILPITALTAKAENVLLDLTEIHEDAINNTVEKNWEYAYQEWDKKVFPLAGKGALVQAPSGKGGFGENKTMVRFGKTPIVEIVFMIGSGNKAENVRLSLEDKDGTIHNFNIPIGTMPKGTTLHGKIDLTKSTDIEKPGKTPGLDLNKIYAWQLKGDWQDAKVEVLFVKIVGLKQ